MAKYRYKAVTPEGSETKGEIESLTLVAARTALAEQGLQVKDLKEKKSILQFEIKKKKIPQEEIMNMSRQLAAFTRAGVPILDGLEVIGEESGNATLRQLLREVREALRGGLTLSEAMSEHHKMFPAFYIDMLRSAELTGKLDYVLDQLARYIERDLEARRKIRGALAYPAIILLASLGTIVILTAFVLPRFRKFFQTLNAQLPLPTRLLLGVTGFISRWWWALILGWILIGLLIYWYVKTPKGHEKKDRLFLKLPIAGELIKYALIERFCRIMSSMVEAGVALPEAMTVVSEGTNNTIYSKALMGVRESMLQGEGIARPIGRTGLFPASITQMMRVGEDTGTLDEQLASAAQFFDQELDFKIKRMTSLFEPAVIVFMGVVVGFVAIALISAMYGIFKQTGKVG